MSSGKLFVVATPIGNLGDITYRAVETLKQVDWIACEDTRHSKVLLDHYGVHKPLISYFDFSEKKRAPELILRLKNGESGALISDAGMPGIADPGYRLITQAIQEEIVVDVLPGPCALINALVLSGMPVDRFSFEGFAPVKDGQKRRWLKKCSEEDRTVIFYESPHRIIKTLEVMKDVLGDVRVVVARELTKKFEEVVRGSVQQAIDRFSTGKVLGEFVVVWNPVK